jgi:EAL domain-containing protein (putative c-di-GMP-specific phosphodiesterase class I)
MALCKAIIVMAHELGIKVIAEGIETEAQRESLALAGCDYGQGYFFSRPVAAAQFEIWLNTSSRQSVQAGQQLTSTQTQKDGRFAKA